MRTPDVLITSAALLVLVLVAPIPAEAVEVAGGLSVGVFQAGTIPRVAVTPHAGISWRKESGFLLAVNDLFNILTPINKAGIGVFNKASVTIGFGWKDIDGTVGPSLSIYSMPECGATFLCGRVVGVAPGGHVQAEVYFAGPLGVSVSGNLDWIGGSSAVLPGGIAAMVVAGPVLRWRGK
jgi:hypothetical protein